MKKYISIALVFVVVLLITAMIIRGSNESDEVYDGFVQQVEQNDTPSLSNPVGQQRPGLEIPCYDFVVDEQILAKRGYTVSFNPNTKLPNWVAYELTADEKSRFEHIGASCHSVEDAQEAESLGADYITAGHVFATDCKKGLPPRGIEFLSSVCESVSIPVYAIGGISPDNIDLVRQCGAAGACVMSGFMKCSDPVYFIKEFEKK